jgi:CHRD domain-containing protein
MVLVCSGVGVAALATSYTVDQNPNTLRAVLTGTNEVPAVQSDARGRIHVDLFPAHERLCFSLVFGGLEAERAHIHRGIYGTGGALEVILFRTPRESPVRACKKDLDPTLLRTIRDHPRAFYVNIHNAAHPNGEIRGQLRQR